MTDSEEFNCIYCEKIYKKSGWLASHIKKKHEIDNLLDKDMTVIRDNAIDLSNQEAAQNLSENSPWDNDAPNSPVSAPRPSSTPRPAHPVPLCPKANNYVIEKGQTLPASFLTTLLPAPGFLDQLDTSLQTQDNVSNLLERFDEHIRCFKCEVCHLTFLGNNSLKAHMETAHETYSQPSRPDPAVGSLSDYLSSLENKIEDCKTLISRQSVMLGKLLTLHEENKRPTNKTIPVIDIEDDLTTRYHLKCDQCTFETDNKSQLNLHKSGKHSDESNQTMNKLIECPMCSFNCSSEIGVRKHIEEKHPDTFSCNKCTQSFINKANLDIHKAESHTEVSHHICNECEKEFNNEVELSIHISDKHNTHNWALLVGDSHVKTVKSRHIERKLKGNKLRNPAASSPRDGSAYTTTRDWPNAHFPNSNLAERVPELLNERSYESLIVLTPSNNIKNVENLGWEDQNRLAIKTSTDTVSIVEKALEQNNSLKKAVIVELPPRADSMRLQELTEFANFTLRNTIEKSIYKSQITFASLDSLNLYTEKDIFGSPSSRKNDGIHMRGRLGATAYTECIVRALKAAGLCLSRSTNTVNMNSSSIATSNYYNVLSN